jgi:hypothetical protein
VSAEVLWEQVCPGGKLLPGRQRYLLGAIQVRAGLISGGPPSADDLREIGKGQEPPVDAPCHWEIKCLMPSGCQPCGPEAEGVAARVGALLAKLLPAPAARSQLAPEAQRRLATATQQYQQATTEATEARGPLPPAPTPPAPLSPNTLGWFRLRCSDGIYYPRDALFMQQRYDSVLKIPVRPQCHYEFICEETDPTRLCFTPPCAELQECIRLGVL